VTYLGFLTTRSLSEDGMPQIIGIDPGATGAISIIDTTEHTLVILDMPIIPVGSSKKRTEVDGGAIADFVAGRDIHSCYIEDVWSLPHDGHVGAFNFGDKYGTVKGVMAAMCIDSYRVRPNVWKLKMKAPADKRQSCERAKRLFPNHADLFARVKDDGRAESAMIALYGVFHQGLSLTKPLEKVAEGGRRLV
jgi:crossover junction endodeoxyribonuclease RuvC